MSDFASKPAQDHEDVPCPSFPECPHSQEDIKRIRAQASAPPAPDVAAMRQHLKEEHPLCYRAWELLSAYEQQARELEAARREAERLRVAVERHVAGGHDPTGSLEIALTAEQGAENGGESDAR